ncbi:MAG TPA: condensation domain-containing protein [Candidatus Dormibacteraeota bacterium]|nr:condensation domain-containing protein [Candidatus Dormibacteraeota bacterium]
MTSDPTLKNVSVAGPAPHTFDKLRSFPLAPGQERMWYAHRIDPSHAAYNGSFRMNLTGPVDASLLERTLNEIVRRHEILRAVIHNDEGPRQSIVPDLHIPLVLTDLRPISADTRDAAMEHICMQEAQRNFDLSRDPLIRVGLLRMDEERFILMLTVHQIVCDGWSIGLIMDELQKIYSASALGQETPLPPLETQFGDYVASQRASTRTAEGAKQIAYWEEKLRGYRRLELSPDLQNPNRASYDAAIISHLLPRELTDRLRDFGNAQGNTFFITTLAACLLLLHRYTGQSDLGVGSPLAGRNRTELETLVGQFVNHIVFRADAAGNPSFSEFVSRVRDSVWEAFANQDVPFETVLQTIRPGQDCNRDPFCLINFICQKEYGRAAKFQFDFSGIRMSSMPSKTQGALYDLNFFLVEREVGWRLSLEYKTALYRAETATRLLDHFKELLEAIAANPNRRLSQFPLSGDAPSFVVPSDPAPKSAVYAMPTSLAQQRFWMLEQLDHGNPAFNMPARVRLTGPLSEQALQQGFQFLIERHEILRTTFEEIDRKIAQVISPAAQFRLAVTDLAPIAATPAGREAQLERRIRDEASIPFNLEKGPLFRAHLFRLEPDQHVLMTSIHHILADGWSQRVIQDDLWAAYDAFLHGRDPSVAPLSIQYGDFVVWQQEWLKSSEAQKHIEFWSQRLRDELPVLDFPTDRQPSGKPASHGAIETLLLPDELIQQLKKVSQSMDATIFVLTLAAFGILLSRHSHQEDVLIGSPVANRKPETEHLVGPLASPVCLRLDFSGNPTLREMIARVRDATFDALSHTDLPFEAVLGGVKMRTVKGRRPIFQFYFFYQAAFLQPRIAGPLTITPMPTFSTGISFEMQLAMIERQEGVRAQLEYNPDLFDPGRIRNILNEFQALLYALARNLFQKPSLDSTRDSATRLSDLPRAT